MHPLTSSYKNMPFSKTPSLICLYALLLLAFQTATGRDFPGEKVECGKIYSLLIFGDSTTDPGNNNHLLTVAKGNFPPYGKDFVDHKATGRLTNGRLVNDFIAKTFGVKDNLPAYLDPTLSIDDLKTGVSFGSAGSGYDQNTATFSNVISLPTQLMYLKEYKRKLELGIGKDQTKKIIDNSLFVTSAGTNDFILNYFTLPIRRLSSTFPEYMKLILQENRKVVQALIDEGARHIGVAGLPPIGCLPVVITLFSKDAFNHRGCISNISVIAQDYNKMLKEELKSLQLESKGDGIQIGYLDVYTPLDEIISGQKYGFEDFNFGCCGIGIVEMGYLCNSLSPVCDDANKYVFWDSMHPTDRAYSVIAQSFEPVIESLFKK